MTRRLAIAAWLGFALAALFFYPLAAALQADVYYLQWQPGDLWETAAAVVPLSLAAAWAVFVLWPLSTRQATLGLVALAALPLASFGAGLSRQLPFEDALRAAWESRAIRLGVPGLFLVTVAAFFALWPVAFNRWLRRLLIMISPASLVVVGSLAASASHAAPVVTVDRPSSGAPTGMCAPVVAWLFDELSFFYLYENGDVRPEFPNIGAFAAAATHYRAVTAPGRETLVAMPSLLAARHLRDVRISEGRVAEMTEEGLVPFTARAPEGLFATARRLGFRTEMAGYYLAYCDLLGNLVDACQSLSFYNASTVRSGFAPHAAVMTTLVLWPRQFPLGLLKNPPFAALQASLVERTTDFARRPLSASGPVFRFVHFSVPHLPFVFDETGYDPPFNPLQTIPDEYYVRQLRFVDRLFGELLAGMRRDGTYDSTTVVLLADHGYRFGGRERDPLHIPFIVKNAGQATRTDVDTPAAGEQLLKQVVEQSCGAAP